MPEPIVTTQWTCNICGSKYTTEENALSCESSHINCKEISNPKYTNRDKYPYRITVTMEDDTLHNYTISEG